MHLIFAAVVAAEEGPCPDALAEYAAYETLLRSPSYFALPDGFLPAIPMVFDATTEWEPVYYGARRRIDALANLTAGRSGCEIERLGCFQRFLSAHTALMTIKQGGGNTTLTAPEFTRFREKTLRWGMSNFLWLVDRCEIEVQKLNASKAGPPTYPIPITAS
jgi:hypothetical protein